MNKKVVVFAYRDWAFKIIKNISNIDSIVIPVEHKALAEKTLKKHIKQNNVFYIENPKDFSGLNLGKGNLFLFYGWSWIIENEIIDNNLCFCLHPSKLPEYRGGSPIQNQIIDGLEESAVSLFKMGSGLDDGPIYKQKKISLLGNLDDVFMEITKKSIPITKELIKDYLNDSISLTVQDETKASSFKRRKKEQSEITLEEIKTKSSKYLYNKVRSLQDPYPNAYIVCGDGKKLYIQCVKIDESE